MSNAADEFERFLDRKSRWPWVVIAVSLLYLAARVAPWALGGFQIAQ